MYIKIENVRTIRFEPFLQSTVCIRIDTFANSFILYLIGVNPQITAILRRQVALLYIFMTSGLY
jgi:hypothetical protein